MSMDTEQNGNVLIVEDKAQAKQFLKQQGMKGLDNQ